MSSLWDHMPTEWVLYHECFDCSCILTTKSFKYKKDALKHGKLKCKKCNALSQGSFGVRKWAIGKPFEPTRAKVAMHMPDGTIQDEQGNVLRA